MNKQEYLLWQHTAYVALLSKYNDSQATAIIKWFDGIKGSDERDLIGDVRVEAMLDFVGCDKYFSSFDTMMARLFIYAPHILEKEGIL